MNVREVGVESMILVDYNVRTESNVITDHVQRQLLATAIMNSGASVAVLDGQSLPIASDYCTHKYQWLVAFGAMLCERADHALALIPSTDDVIDGYTVCYRNNYVTRFAMPPHEDDHKFQLVREGTEWQIKAQCTVTCLGNTYPDSIEVGHVKGRCIRNADISDVEKQMYEATARVWCMQHRNACISETQKEQLDYSYEHKD